jgi:ATP-dependent helicase/DNAse subunit B
LSPPDEADDDLDRWLDARQFGTLLHELFRTFLSELTAAAELPVFDRHIGRLTTLLNEAIAACRRDVPAPSENAFRRDCLKLLQIAKTFLQEEQQNCQSQTPKYFEAALGMTAGDFATDLDQEAPVAVQLADGRTLRARGQIDRIDQISELVYSICDYKTGSAYGYVQDNPFRNGRRVQNILYLKMVERVLRERVNPAARVALFEYFFPGTKANGLRRFSNVSQQTMVAGTGSRGAEKFSGVAKWLTQLKRRRPPIRISGTSYFTDWIRRSWLKQRPAPEKRRA